MGSPLRGAGTAVAVTEGCSPSVRSTLGGDRLGRSHTLPARLGAVHLPSREGMRRSEGGDGEGVPSPYRWDGA